MVNSGSGIIFVCDFSFSSDVNCFLFFFSGITWVIGSGAYAFNFPNLVFGIFSIFGVTVKSWLLTGCKESGFSVRFTGWISSGCASTIGNLRGYALVNDLYCCTIFIWVHSWLTPWSFFWPNSLNGALGGNAGGIAFLNISARVFNASLCPFPNLTRDLEGDVLCSA